MRFFLFPIFILLTGRLEAGISSTGNMIEVCDTRGVVVNVTPEKGKIQKKKKTVTKQKANRKLRFNKPFMFLNPLIAHLLLLPPTQHLSDSLGA